MIQVVLAQPHGSRAGVERAIGIDERSLRSARFPARWADRRDVCYATQIRQQFVHGLAKLFGLILVVGSCKVGSESGIGLTADANAPETLVEGVMTGLRRFGEITVSTVFGVAEDVKSKFPAEAH